MMAYGRSTTSQRGHDRRRRQHGTALLETPLTSRSRGTRVALLSADSIVITARDIRKVFGRRIVLDGLSLTVEPGECVALLGANGAGKSTFLKIVATVLKPTSGILEILGHDARRMPERVRGQIALVGHGTHIYEDLTALENLRVWRTLADRPSDDATLRRALATVELDAFADERARAFSAGMKRRLSIARFVDVSLRLLLLDEPWSGLDQQGKKWLGEFLLGVKSRGGAVLLTTHDFASSLDVADRVAVIGAGTVALERSRDALDRTELEALYAMHADEA